VALALAPGEACYIPCGHRKGDGLSLDLSQEQTGGAIMQMNEADVLARLKPLLEDDAVLKIGQNLKYDALIFLQRGIRLNPIDDTMLISYVLSRRRGQGQGHLRLCPGGGGDPIFRRGCRCHPAPGAAAEAEAGASGQARGV
jgi:DNA polymerase I-like protein with 3'-5' exonuclease and polymerase domains